MKKKVASKQHNNLARKLIVSSSHLAGTDDSWQMSELEYALIVAFNAFSRWTTHCMAACGHKEFNNLDILILHNINHRGREKRISDISMVLNIEDTHTANYAIKKLMKAGLVEGVKKGKEIFYSTTEAGCKVCEDYRDIRQSCLMEVAVSSGQNFDEMSQVAILLRNVSGLYDQASRAAASL